MVKIDQIISMISDTKLREATLMAFNQYRDIFMVDLASVNENQSYSGGLLDHTLLVTLISISIIQRMVEPLMILYNSDHIIIASIFHDFEKLKRFTFKKPIFQTCRDVIEFLEENNIDEPEIINGIMYLHNGNSYDKDYEICGGIISISESIATNRIKKLNETRRMIEEIYKHIFKSSDFPPDTPLQNTRMRF